MNLTQGILKDTTIYGITFENKYDNIKTILTKNEYNTKFKINVKDVASKTSTILIDNYSYYNIVDNCNVINCNIDNGRFYNSKLLGISGFTNTNYINDGYFEKCKLSNYIINGGIFVECVIDETNKWNYGYVELNEEQGYIDFGTNWTDGVWNQGTFRGNWSGGTFNGGLFSAGSKWYDGTANGGKFSGSTDKPIYWYDGLVRNGFFNNCIFENGIFNNGTYSDVIFNNGIFNDGTITNSVISGGTINGGFINNCIINGDTLIKGGIFSGGTIYNANVFGIDASNLNIYGGNYYSGLYENINFIKSQITGITNNIFNGTYININIYINGAIIHHGNYIDSKFKNIIINNGYFTNCLSTGITWKNGSYNDGKIYNSNWYDGNCNDSDFFGIEKSDYYSGITDIYVGNIINITTTTTTKSTTTTTTTTSPTTTTTTTSPTTTTTTTSPTTTTTTTSPTTTTTTTSPTTTTTTTSPTTTTTTTSPTTTTTTTPNIFGHKLTLSYSTLSEEVCTTTESYDCFLDNEWFGEATTIISGGNGDGYYSYGGIYRYFSNNTFGNYYNCDPNATTTTTTTSPTTTTTTTSPTTTTTTTSPTTTTTTTSPTTTTTTIPPTTTTTTIPPTTTTTTIPPTTTTTTIPPTTTTTTTNASIQLDCSIVDLSYNDIDQSIKVEITLPHAVSVETLFTFTLNYDNGQQNTTGIYVHSGESYNFKYVPISPNSTRCNSIVIISVSPNNQYYVDNLTCTIVGGPIIFPSEPTTTTTTTRKKDMITCSNISFYIEQVYQEYYDPENLITGNEQYFWNATINVSAPAFQRTIISLYIQDNYNFTGNTFLILSTNSKTATAKYSETFNHMSNRHVTNYSITSISPITQYDISNVDNCIITTTTTPPPYYRYNSNTEFYHNKIMCCYAPLTNYFYYYLKYPIAISGQYVYTDSTTNNPLIGHDNKYIKMGYRSVKIDNNGLILSAEICDEIIEDPDLQPI